MLSNARAEVVAEACEHVFSSDVVLAAEFRKTITVGRRTRGASAKITASLRDHLSGFIKFAETTERAPRLSMPITFARSRPNSEPASDELFAFDRLRSLWSVYSALNLFCEDHPLTSQFITGIDVVGNEIWTSNWPFVVIFADAQSRPALTNVSRSAHAGEFFRWRMQGLRAIGELLLPNCVVERIGHALALDRAVTPSSPTPSSNAINYRDMVEDLCWLHQVSIERQQVEEFLHRIVNSTRMSTYGINMVNVLDSWKARRTIHGLRDERLIGPDIYSEADWPLEILPASEFEFSSSPRRALIALIYRGSGPLNLLDLDAGNLGLEYISWSDSIADRVADLLLQTIASSGVVIESCPTSNVILSRLLSINEHPIARFIDCGISVSLNSDDPLIFGTNVAREASRIRRYFGEEVLHNVSATSITSCCPSVAPLDASRRSHIATAIEQELAI
jgi:hypothetical protein